MSDDDYITGFESDDGKPAPKFTLNGFARGGTTVIAADPADVKVGASVSVQTLYSRKELLQAAQEPANPESDDREFAARMKRRRGEAPPRSVTAQKAAEVGRMIHSKIEAPGLQNMPSAHLTPEMLSKAIEDIKSMHGTPTHMFVSGNHDDMLDAMAFGVAGLHRGKGESDEDFRERTRKIVYGGPQLYVPKGADEDER